MEFSIVGELYTWGRDEGEGRLGLGSGGGPGEGGSLGTPSKVNALPVPVAAVSCGGFFTMALTSEGKVWNWGGEDILKSVTPYNSCLKMLHVFVFASLEILKLHILLLCHWTNPFTLYATRLNLLL